MIVCLEPGTNDLHNYGPADATATPSSLFCITKILIGLTFLVPSYPGCPGKEAVKRASVSLSLAGE